MKKTYTIKLPFETVGELVDALNKYPREMEVRLGFYIDPDNHDDIEDDECVMFFDRHVYVDKMNPRASVVQNAFEREIVVISLGIDDETMKKLSHETSSL